MKRQFPFVLLGALTALLHAGVALAQSAPYTLAARPPNVSQVLPQLFGPNGLIVDSDAGLDGGPAVPGSLTHRAHFNSAFQSEFSNFSTGFARKIVSVPLPAPGSSFVFEYNSSGDLVRVPKSFGPILAERTDTVGGRRTSFGFAFQRFDFTANDGISLNALPAVFEHDDPVDVGVKADVVSTRNTIEASVSQVTGFVTYGISDRMDLSVAVPLVTTSVAAQSVATIERLGLTAPDVHYFRQADGSKGTQRIFTSSGRATGLGDITVRLKARSARWARSALGFGVDVRIPTGDEENLLGAGAAGLKPFAIWSGSYGMAAAHINVGYQWNGSSSLAGTFQTGGSRSLPDQMSFVVGTDLRLSARVTTAFDVLGDRVINGARLAPVTFVRAGVSLPSIAVSDGSFTEWNGSAGLKVLLSEGLLLNANLLFKLNESGLRSRVTALIGVGYSR